jgi:3-dehydroquinate dehydratase-1
VILTVRLAAEGGRWQLADEERASLFAAGLGNLSAIDVELRSPLLPKLARDARAQGTTIIVSHHDFDRTPDYETLSAIVTRAATHRGVVKIATMIQREEDVATLRQLLARKWPVPLCVIGMGARGAATRVEFAKLGSCLTYGYLDAPSAPGQPSAAELVALMRSQHDPS